MRNIIRLASAAALIAVSISVNAQIYPKGVIDKSVAVVGNEMISISDIEQELQMMKAQGMSSDQNARCELLERMMESRLFLMQARLDSLSINQDMVTGELSQRLDQIDRKSVV